MTSYLHDSNDDSNGDSSSEHSIGLPIHYEGDESTSTSPSPSQNDDILIDENVKDDTMKQVQVPTHPIASMQDAFAESMLEAAESPSAATHKPALGTAAARRKWLLDQDISEETHASRWCAKNGQQYHQLWKLMAQISFGMYLLLNGIARDDEQVMSILQGHVDEVDEFLEMTLEDFDLALEDIDERLKFLKLPLENIEIFDAMLEDRTFRLQIVSGNERIEHVITRTAKAMNDALKDVQQGLDACKEFTIYLAEEQEDSMWKGERPDMVKVFDAMKGNVEGWHKAYVSLQTKGNQLGVTLVQLGSIVAEMDRRAGEISRQTRFSIAPTSPAESLTPPQPSKGMRQSMSKHLPSDPNMITPAIRATIPSFQLVQDRDKSVESASPSSSPEREEERKPEPDFILKPHTYSPLPSPGAMQEQARKQLELSPSRSKSPPETSPSRHEEYQEKIPVPSSPRREELPPPDLKKRSSLRKRFSLKRKETPPELNIESLPIEEPYWGPRHRLAVTNVVRNRVNSTPGPVELSAITAPTELPNNTPSFVTITNAKTKHTTTNNNKSNSPPSRGVDSAYYSDLEKPRSPPQAIHPSNIRTPNPSTPLSAVPSQLRSAPLPSTTSLSSRSPVPAPIITPSSATSPLPPPENQFFRPVIASPHSPLQRPWTAAPSQPRHTHTPSALGNRGLAPSAMGMSMMSELTTITENGRKVKKKRSAFGWLKKAFSLSEEERAAFEEKRRLGERENERHEKGPRFLDGKRIR
ncbi:hypothetical protein B7494_g25 [Chlorociboria aeruginascens]|nr:hypothetical protein B7494_g25 [Chlorociboria aeruginascens]